ncbi:MAG: 50S ribosomal protein L29 [Candidatus Dasytiphilus stammeri]
MDKNKLFNKEKDISSLKMELVHLEQELFNLRIQKKINQGLLNNNLLKESRRNIARIKTFITLKKSESHND